MGWYEEFAPYVSVAERKRKAAKEIEKLKKKGREVQPIVIEGKSIANTFWGKAWCKNLESYSDYSNRLPRGRSYVRHGSVIDLKLGEGEVTAKVYGSSIYKVKIAITKVAAKKWNAIVNECAGKIDSLIELLQGKFSTAVMEIITDPKKGLFPHPSEIKLNCSCPDWADMCKHVAAVLYGVGARLDEKPEELFILRQANHVELIAKAGTTSSLNKHSVDDSDQLFADSELSSLFGIDLKDSPLKNSVSQGAIVNSKKQRIEENKKPAKTNVISVKAKVAKKSVTNKSSVRIKKSKSKAKVNKKLVLKLVKK
ncbi:MAG: SWIM zinc finger family protein [Gammaproteobacteria bacterium]